MLFWQRSMKRLAATQMQMNRSNPDPTATAGYCMMIAIANTNKKIIATKLRIGVPFVFMGAKIQINLDIVLWSQENYTSQSARAFFAVKETSYFLTEGSPSR